MLSGAVVSSFNQFSEGRRTPSRTVGSGHCNNNNAKSNLNYALKRLGQNNPRHKHKRGGGRSRSTAGMLGGWAGEAASPPLCVDVPPSRRWDLSTVVLIFGCKDDEGVYFGK